MENIWAEWTLDQFKEALPTVSRETPWNVGTRMQNCMPTYHDLKEIVMKPRKSQSRSYGAVASPHGKTPEEATNGLTYDCPATPLLSQKWTQKTKSETLVTTARVR